MKPFKQVFNCYLPTLAAKLASLAFIVSLAGCSLFSGDKEISNNELDDNQYTVLVLINESLKTQVEPNLKQLEQLLAHQNQHYRAEMRFTVQLDPSTRNKCLKNYQKTNLEAIESGGDRFVSCLLNEGNYRSLAYINKDVRNKGNDSKISINLLDRKGHPRLGYFTLPKESSVNDVISSELFLWLNEQARFADLKTW